MLHVLLLGMLHAACDVSFHEALGFIFHASCHVASWHDYCHAFVLHSMRLSKLSWMSGVDQRWQVLTLLECVQNTKADTDQGHMNHVSCFMRLLTHIPCYVECHASCFIPDHNLSTPRFVLHLMLHVMIHAFTFHEALVSRSMLCWMSCFMSCFML